MESRRPFNNLFWIFLLPLSLFWAFATYWRRKNHSVRKQYRSRLAVICVGNIHSGGSGKTPLVLELARRYRSSHPCIISRGYRGALSKTGARVDLNQRSGPELYGDEPWMLAQHVRCPVFIGRDRVRQVMRIEKEETGRPLIILDDGFQHLRLAHTFALIAINVRQPVENSFCLPLGNLREPLSAIRTASAAVLMGDAESAVSRWGDLIRNLAPSLPVFHARRFSEGLWDGDVPHSAGPEDRILAFSGIADPQGFLDEVRKISKPLFFKTFGDHHHYHEDDIEFLLEKQRVVGANVIVTTEKDWFKVKPRFHLSSGRLVSLRIRYELPEEFWYFLDKRLETG